MSKEAMKLAREALEGLRNSPNLDSCEELFNLGDEAITALREALNASLAEQPAPTVESNSQDWRGMDGATAWHLIDRHANGWADVGKMMGEWLLANQALAEQPAPSQYGSPELQAMVVARAMEKNAAAQPAQQEPVATLFGSLPVYDTSPPAQRTWVGLTDEDVRQCSQDVVAGGPENSVDRFAYAIEAKLKEKNT